jgi:hypothetical protein
VETEMTDLGVAWALMLTPKQWMCLLKAFKNKHGHCDVPRKHSVKYMERSWNLGSWLNNRRTDRKNNVLDEDVETKMMNLGVAWVMMLTPKQWIFLLKTFKDEHGNFDVPRKHIMEYMGRKKDLGFWLNKQRNAKKRGDLDEDVETEMRNLGLVL